MKYYFPNTSLLFSATLLNLNDFNNLLLSDYEALVHLVDIGSFTYVSILKDTCVNDKFNKKLLLATHNNYFQRIRVLNNYIRYNKKGTLLDNESIDRYLEFVSCCDLFIPIHLYSITDKYIDILFYRVKELNESSKIIIKKIYLVDISFLFIEKKYNIVMNIFSDKQKKLINIDKIEKKVKEQILISQLIGNYCVSESRGQRSAIWRGRNVYCYLYGIPLIYEKIEDIGNNIIFSKDYVLSKDYDEIVAEQKKYFEILFSNKLLKTIEL